MQNRVMKLAVSTKRKVIASVSAGVTTVVASSNSMADAAANQAAITTAVTDGSAMIDIAVGGSLVFLGLIVGVGIAWMILGRK